MRNLNLDQLQTLIAIADLGTFAAAAQALHLAPPTVSLHIKELESRLEAELVVRGRRQAELTPAGEVLVQEGRQLLQAADDLVERVRRRACGREGVVRVGVSAGVSTQLLPRMLEALAQRSPGVEIRLEAVGSAESMQRLKAGSLDIGIVASPQPPCPRCARCLGAPTPWWPCCPPHGTPPSSSRPTGLPRADGHRLPQLRRCTGSLPAGLARRGITLARSSH